MKQTSPDDEIRRRAQSLNIRKVGLPRSLGRDLYHFLRTASWPALIATIGLGFLALNLVFTALFLAFEAEIANVHAGSFTDVFFFSMQSMATIGYGYMYPVDEAAELIVTAEAIAGLVYTAVATGIVFSKFGTPQPRVMFSRNVLIAPYDGAPTLLFRMANGRANHMIVEATVNVTLAWDETEPHGGMRRRLVDLPLTRNRTPLFALSWTAMHVITPESPLHGMTPEDVRSKNVAVLVTFTGIDDTLSQTVHGRYVYPYVDVLFDHRFADVLAADGKGGRVIDYTKFHDVVPLGGG